MEISTRVTACGTRRRIAQAVLVAFGLSQGTPVSALPTGAEVTAGTAAVSSAGSAMTIHQSTPRAAINWQQFNIGPGESVQFVQPGAAAIALNRVLGQDPTTILGRLSANGQIFLLNPNGVLFGPGAQVNVGGIVASTLGLSDADFMAGRYRFSGQRGAVTNRGAIEAAEGGYVVLLAPHAANAGTISAPLGTAALAAGEQVTLTLADNRLLAVAVDGAAVGALAENRQLIRADGGQVLLTAKARDALLATVVNNEGVIEARSASVANGVVRLEGGDAGVVSVGGTIDASGRAPGATGGTIEISGDKVALRTDARIDASGAAGGGTVLVGGDVQGGNPAVRNADRTFVARGASVAADAIAAGDGGKIVVWGTTSAQVHGSLTANGGAAGGDGGFVETSGRHLDVDGARIEAAAPYGRGGTWLLDPYNLTISGAATAGTDNNANVNPDWNATGTSAVVQASQIAAKLNAGTSVIVTTGDGSGAQDGDLTVAASIAKTAGGDAALTLRAHDQVTLNNNVSISSTAGRLDVTLNADSDGANGGSVTLNSGSSILTNGGSVTLGGGANPAAAPAAGGATSTAYGVRLNNATVDSAGGAISIRGEGRSGTPNTVTARHGVVIEGGSRVASGGGAVTVVGRGGVATGGAGRDTNYGVYVNGANSRIESGAGALSVTGAGGGNRDNNFGVYVNGANARLVSTTGAITVTGTGGAGRSSNRGVSLNGNGARIETADGAITVTGQGDGTGATNYGVHLQNAARIEATGAGSVAVTGTGGNGTNTNYGVYLQSNNTRVSTTTGSVTLTGRAQGLGTNNIGIRMDNTSAVQSADGAIVATGTGGGGTSGNNRNAHGVYLAGGNAKIAATGAGSITLQGTGGTAGTGNTRSHGVVITGASTRVESAAGDIAVTGTAAQTGGAQNYGVYVTGGDARIASTGGDVAVTGAGGTGTNDNYGVYVNGSGARVASIDGDVTVTGSSGGTGNNNFGVRLQGAARVEAIGAGNVAVIGTGGNGAGTNYGVYLQTNDTLVSTTTGNLTLTGQAQGSAANNMGVRMENASALQTVDGTITVSGTGAAGTTGNHGVYLRGGNVKAAATGTGSVSVTGVAGAGTDDNVGVRIDQNNTRVETVSGDIVVSGTGNGSGLRNYGVYLLNNGTRATSTAGDVAVAGTGGNGANDNYGVYLTGTATRFASGSGDTSVTGTGRGGGTNNYGVRLNAGAQVTSSGPGTGAIALAGTGAGAAPGVITTGTGTLIGAAGHAGDITVSADTATGADSIVLAGTALRGTGRLFLQPIDPAATIGAAGGAGEFNLSAAELGLVQNGFDAITLGRANGTGALTTGTYAYNADLTLRGATSNISVGQTTMPAPGGNDAGTLTLDTSGAVTQSGRIAATNLVLLGGGGSHTLTNAANAVGTLAASTGAVNVLNSGALTIGTVGATAGLSTTGDATVVTAAGAGNDITLANGIASGGGDVVLASGEDIHYGTATISAGGRWLTYSRSPAQNTGAVPVPGNAKPNLYNRTYAANPPPTITAPGDHNIYSYQPSLTVTADNQAKPYGEPVPALTATITGFVNGDTAADAYSGAPGLATIATATSSTAGNPYPIAVAPGTLASDVGYAFTFANGQLTVVPRPVTVAADAGQGKVYGDPDPPAYAYTITGGPGTTGSAIVAGDVVNGALARAGGENAGAYAIAQGTLAVAPAIDYAVTYVGRDFTVTPATLTYVADPVSVPAFAALPTFTGTVTGFKGADNLGNATTGTIAFASTVPNAFVPGVYPIWGAGLTANNGNYAFAQAPGNATAFEVAAGAQRDAADRARAQRIARCSDADLAYAGPGRAPPCTLPPDRGEPLASQQRLVIEDDGIRLPQGLR